MNPVDPLEAGFIAEKKAALSAPKKASLLAAMSADPARGKVSNLWRMIRARLGPGKLSMGEYKTYAQLAEPGSSLYAFAGVRTQHRAHAVCNDRDWFSVTKNKLVFELLMRGAGLPVTTTIAAFDRKGRGSGVPVLSSREELISFLKNSGNYPLFCKPTTGVNSLGTLLLEDPDEDTCIVNHGSRRTYEDIAGFILETSPKGFLFQEVLLSDPEFSTVSETEALCSLRIFVLLKDGEARIERSLAKIPGEGEVADNFWRKGAQLWAIERDNGLIIRKVMSEGDSPPRIIGRDLLSDNDEGLKIPKFREACEVVLSAARILSGIQTQSWDIALTDRGPVLLEVNFGGDLSLAQIAYGEGILSRDYCRHLSDLGYKGPLPEFN